MSRLRQGQNLFIDAKSAQPAEFETGVGFLASAGQAFPEIQELLTIKEAAHLINVHPNTLRNWEKEGKLSALRVGSRRDRRFTKASITGLVFSAPPTPGGPRPL